MSDKTEERYDIPKMLRISQENLDWLEAMHDQTGQPYVFIVNRAMQSVRSGNRFNVPKKVFYEEKITTRRVTKKQQKQRNLRQRSKIRKMRSLMKDIEK